MDERQINVEQQRAKMQELLRSCASAVLLAVDKDDQVHYSAMNTGPVELAGLATLLQINLPELLAQLRESDSD